MKQLGLLFGNTSQAAAATLSAFFGGLAVGSWFWGKRSERMKNPLRSYAWLEVGIAVTALLYFVVLHIFYAIYPFFYQNIQSAELLLLAKFAIAMFLIFPPALFMGGTIPVIGQYVITKQSDFGKRAALLYGINTLGASLGAYLAGFHFPLWLGFNRTCILAMTVTTAIAAIAFFLSRTSSDATAGRNAENAEKTSVQVGTDSTKSVTLFLCFLSGFGVLALEVLWMRMFAQVLENSVYTFAAILVTVLICLAVGALISSILARLAWSPKYVLATVVLLGGVAAAITPFLFMGVTGGLQVLTVRASWAAYIFLIFKKCFMAVGIPACTLGIVFPYLMKTEEGSSSSAGKSLGRLAGINTAGAIAGSLLCGFVFLRYFGMWRTMQIISVVYLAAVVLMPLGWKWQGVVLRISALLFVIAHFNVLNAGNLPVTSKDSSRQSEVVLETWEASDCTVVAVRDVHGISIKVNSHYGLGSTGSMALQTMQADIPLKIHPKPDKVFFLGMGTGVTAGAALHPDYAVKRIVTCELVPEVIVAAKKYIADDDGYDHTAGLFSDPRSTVLAEDGRHFLMATKERFDLIDSDLFIPYRSGAGSLYSKEHFENVRDKLNDGGLFFQWLPLYQVTENEFGIIARTMLEVFDQVTLWRNNFQPGSAVVAIVGHKDRTPLPASDIESSESKAFAVEGRTHRDLMRLALPFDPKTVMFFYCGNLTPAKDILFKDYPVNTDDRPLIEYMAPRSFRNKGGVSIPWFIGPPFAEMVDKIQNICPADDDPLLVNRTAANRRLPAAGAAFHWARIWQVIGDEGQCSRYWARFLNKWLD